jgi:hypothetical protein
MFLQVVSRTSECTGVGFSRSNPRSADFDMQLFNGIDGRNGRWEWVLYRTDITERLAFGEEENIDTVAKSVCVAVLDHAGAAGQGQ